MSGAKKYPAQLRTSKDAKQTSHLPGAGLSPCSVLQWPGVAAVLGGGYGAGGNEDTSLHLPLLTGCTRTTLCSGRMGGLMHLGYPQLQGESQVRRVQGNFFVIPFLGHSPYDESGEDARAKPTSMVPC